MAKQYTLAEVKAHNNNQSSWIVINNNVYDVTAFLNEVRLFFLKHRIQFFDLELHVN